MRQQLPTHDHGTDPPNILSKYRTEHQYSPALSDIELPKVAVLEKPPTFYQKFARVASHALPWIEFAIATAAVGTVALVLMTDTEGRKFRYSENWTRDIRKGFFAVRHFTPVLLSEEYDWVKDLSSVAGMQGLVRRVSRKTFCTDPEMW